MEGFENGTISLDNERGVYYPGQTINGQINFTLAQPTAISAINIQFLGEARVLWTEYESLQQHGRTIQRRLEYRAMEPYFNILQCLYGGQGISQLQAGSHSIPFQFQIPGSVPSSFEGDKGEVSYEITAIMEAPGQEKMELTKTYTVVAPIDLNREDPEIAKPQNMTFEEDLTCGCSCSASPLQVEVSLPVGGYCPRQAIPVSVHVKNNANVEVKRIILQVITRTRYHSHQPPAKFTTPEDVLASATTKAVLGNMERRYSAELLVPDMIAPNLAGCGIIDIGYFLKVTVKLAGCNDDLEDKMEIFIGQIPLNNFTDGQYVHPMAHSLPSGPVPEYHPRAINEINPISANPGFQHPPPVFNTLPTAPALNPYPTSTGPALNAYPTSTGPAPNAYPNSNGPPFNAYPVSSGSAINAYPVSTGPALNAYPPSTGPALNAYPPSTGPALNAYPPSTAPHLNHPYPSSGRNSPSYDIGFKVNAPLSNQPLGPVYPNGQRPWNN